MEKFPSPEDFSRGGKPRRFPQRFQALFHGARKAAKQVHSRGEDGFTHNRQPLLLLLLFSFILLCSVFVGAQCGGCVKLPAQKAAADQSKRQAVFPGASAVPFCRCARRRMPKSRPLIRPTQRRRRFRPPLWHGIACRTAGRIQTVRAPEPPCGKAETPAQTPPCFPYSVRSPVPFAGRWRTRKTYPKNNSINPKGRNKCTLSFRKKCCWTI